MIDGKKKEGKIYHYNTLHYTIKLCPFDIETFSLLNLGTAHHCACDKCLLVRELVF